MNKIRVFPIAYLTFASAFTANPQQMRNPNGTPLGFPFQLHRGMTITEVAERIDHHFGYKHRREPTSNEYKLFDLTEPKDSLFFDGVGPITHLSYFLFKDTLLDVRLEFRRDGNIVIDTSYFIRSYRYEHIYYQWPALCLRDSGFAIVINPRKDSPTITFTDMGVEKRRDQYRRYLERQLAEDSIVLVVLADSENAYLRETLVRTGDEIYSPSPMSLGTSVRFEELKTTVRFNGIGVRKSQRGKELTAEIATVFLTTDHDGLKKEVAISASSNRPCSYCQCVGVADDLPTWLICASGFKKSADTYHILVNINRRLLH